MSITLEPFRLLVSGGFIRGELSIPVRKDDSHPSRPDDPATTEMTV